MATKRRKKATRRRSRRRMGALAPGSTIMKVAALAAGYFLGDKINTIIDVPLTKVFKDPAIPDASGQIPANANPNQTGQYVAIAAEVGGGAYLMMKGRKTMLKTVAGGILAGAGLKRALKKFGVISGYQSVPVLAGLRGYQSVPVLAGVPGQLQGYGSRGSGMGVPAQLSNYRPGGSGVNGSQKIMGTVANGSGVTTGSEYMN